MKDISSFTTDRDNNVRDRINSILRQVGDAFCVHTLIERPTKNGAANNNSPGTDETP